VSVIGQSSKVCCFGNDATNPERTPEPHLTRPRRRLDVERGTETKHRQRPAAFLIEQGERYNWDQRAIAEFMSVAA